MSALTEDFWVCAGCRSLNNARAGQCYNCRTPRDLAEVDPATIEANAHGQVRPLDLPAFRPSRGVAALASVLLLAIAGIEVVDTVVTSSLMLQILNGVQAAPEQLRYVGTLGILAVGIGALALIGWSLWLSRAVTAMPALGLGYPPTSGAMAFVENFLPIINLFRVPLIVRDVVERVQPAARRTGPLVFTAWIALLVGFTVPRIVVLLAGEAARSDPGALRTEFVISVAGAVMVITGSIVLVALIWWVEDHITASRAHQIADAHAAQAAWQSPVAAPALDAVELRSAFAAMGGATVTDADTMTPSDDPEAAAGKASAPTQGIAADSSGTVAEPHADARSIGEVDSTAPTEEASVAAMPDDVAAMPDDVAAMPDDVAAMPDDVAAMPDDVAAMPDDVAAMPDDVAAMPDDDAAMPDDVAAKPDDVAAMPDDVAAMPDDVAATEEIETAPTDHASGIPVGVRATQPEPVEGPPAEPAVEARPEPPPVTTATSEEPDALDDPMVASTRAPEERPPTLTIRVASRGMMLAEMDGQTEPVILDDLTDYAEALAKVGGSASIIVPEGDGLGDLIARRAQRILEDADVVVTIR